MTATDFIRYEPRFIEDALFYALRGHEREREFQRERNRLYAIADPDERDSAFQKLDQEWFQRLDLAVPIDRAVGEQPLLSRNLARCLVARAPGKKEEGAELFVNPQANGIERAAAGIFLQPQSLLDSTALLALLRHELLHLADMLDPGFGYEPTLPAAEGGPTHDRLLADRYRILWDATIDGRLARRGWARESARAERLLEFSRAFSMFGAETETIFNRFFDAEAPSHAELVAFAYDPRGSLGAVSSKPHPGSRCALCGFPTHDFEPEPDRLPAHALAEIAQDFPRWRPEHGLCRQCADLYRTFPVSNRAATSLPGAYPSE